MWNSQESDRRLRDPMGEWRDRWDAESSSPAPPPPPERLSLPAAVTRAGLANKILGA